jgi:hypothetical protein
LLNTSAIDSIVKRHINCDVIIPAIRFLKHHIK